MEISKNWFASNIAHFIAIFVILIWGILSVIITVFLLRGTPNSDLTVLMAFWGGITGTSSLVLSYYFSSTQSSKLKDQTISALNASKI